MESIVFLARLANEAIRIFGGWASNRGDVEGGGFFGRDRARPDATPGSRKVAEIVGNAAVDHPEFDAAGRDALDGVDVEARGRALGR